MSKRAAARREPIQVPVDDVEPLRHGVLLHYEAGEGWVTTEITMPASVAGEYATRSAAPDVRTMAFQRAEAALYRIKRDS